MAKKFNYTPEAAAAMTVNHKSRMPPGTGFLTPGGPNGGGPHGGGAVRDGWLGENLTGEQDREGRRPKRPSALYTRKSGGGGGGGGR